MLGVLVALLGAAGCGAPARPTSAILIVLDTLRADGLSAYGNRRETTPNLDRLAREGVLFETAVTNAPWTLAAMAALLAAEYPTARVFYDRLRLSRVETLRAAGWRTAAFTGGGFVSKYFGFDRGFDVFEEVQGKSQEFAPANPNWGKSGIEPIFAQARRWLRESGDEPFFLLVHTYEPHMPYRRRLYAEGLERGGLGETYEIVHIAMAKEGQLPIGEPELAYIRALYDGGVAASDRHVGELLDTLEKLGVADETLVVVTSDHGEDLGERVPLQPGTHGHALYDEQLLVPLIIHDPTRDYPVRRVAAQVRTIDVLPTVLEILGVGTAPDGRGRSLLPLMLGEEDEDRLAWIEIPESKPMRLDAQVGIRTGREKLVVKPSAGGEPWLGLFDLDGDAEERSNLADREPALRSALDAELRGLRADLRAEGVARYRRVPDLSEKIHEQLQALGYLE